MFKKGKKKVMRGKWEMFFFLVLLRSWQTLYSLDREFLDDTRIEGYNNTKMIS